MGRQSILIIGVFVLTMSSAALAEDVWIKSDNVLIREGKGAVYPVVAAAPKGTKLNVLMHERKWLKVSVPSKEGEAKEGYVYEDAVSNQEVGGNGTALLIPTGEEQSSVLSSGSAARGLQPDTETYSKSHNQQLGMDRLNAAIALRSGVSGKQWEDFTTSGKVGPAAQ